jgi:hypothetical protein
MLSSSLAAKGLPPAPLPIDAAVAVLCVLAVTCGIVLPRHMATWLSTRIARRNPAPDKSAASWTDRQLQWITFAIACLTLGLLIAALPPWQDVCTWVYRMLHRGFVWSDPFLAALILAIIAAIQSPAFLVLGMALTCLGRLSGRGRAWQVRVCGWSLLGTAAGIASARPALIWLPAQMLPALAALPVLATALICAFRLDSIADSNNQAHVKTRLLKGHRRELNTLAFAPSIEDRPLGVHRPLADPLVDVARPAATGRGPDSRRRLTA